MGNWTTRHRDMAYKVIVWSNSDQRITDKLDAPSKPIAEQMCAQIKSEDPDLDAWVCSSWRKAEEQAA